jgi:hypothetical protein
MESLMSLPAAKKDAEKVAEDEKANLRRLKRRHILKDLTARLKSWPSQSLHESQFFPQLPKPPSKQDLFLDRPQEVPFKT